MKTRSFSNALLWAAFIAFVSVLLLASVALFYRPAKLSEVPGRLDLASCVEQTMKYVQPPIPGKAVDVGTLNAVTQRCLTTLGAQGRLDDFLLRRLPLLHQHYAQSIVLWLVIVVVISGISLSGLQIIASLRLARASAEARTQGGELSIEAGKLSLKSSIAGIVILGLSLAFFWLYLKEVFTVVSLEIDPDKKTTQAATSKADTASSPSPISANSGAPALRAGGLLPPSGEKTPAAVPRPAPPK